MEVSFFHAAGVSGGAINDGVGDGDGHGAVGGGGNGAVGGNGTVADAIVNGGDCADDNGTVVVGGGGVTMACHSGRTPESSRPWTAIIYGCGRYQRSPSTTTLRSNSLSCGLDTGVLPV